ncbi:MAG TPA: adenylate/guanylate cyclase domain-containing protein [Azospirillaceae bacterium]|nr:adenylate/guanylate cyclase domain-containing protein [Azospirillaceae bacterium]
MNNAYEVFACDGQNWYLAGSHPTEEKAHFLLDEVWKDREVLAVKLVAEVIDKRTGDLKDKVIVSRQRRDGLPYFNSKKATLSKPKPAERAAPRAPAAAPAAEAPRAAPPPRRPARSTAAEVAPTLGKAGSIVLACAAFLIVNHAMGSPVPPLVGVPASALVAGLVIFRTFRILRPHFMVEVLPEGIPLELFKTLPARRRKAARRQEEKPAESAGAKTPKPEQPSPEEAAAALAEATAAMKALLAMTASAVEALKTYRGGHLRLDRQDRFGICLFLAGAADAYCDGMEAGLKRRVAEEVVRAVASDPAMVGWFLDSMSVHLTDRRGAEIHRRGAEAGRMLAEGMPGAEGLLPGAMADWASSRDPGDLGRTVIMFTDLVGSTQDAWTEGDAAHLERVRAHDGIVRSALATFRGREVKHTGDGIMAAFAAEAEAVGAGLRILEDFEKARQSGFGMLDIRIGVSTGPAMHEGADIFGRTVQLAARLTSVAPTGGMAVTIKVADAAGPGFRFESIGVREMKGLPQPVEVFVASRAEEVAALS